LHEALNLSREAFLTQWCSRMDYSPVSSFQCGCTWTEDLPAATAHTVDSQVI